MSAGAVATALLAARRMRERQGSQKDQFGRTFAASDAVASAETDARAAREGGLLAFNPELADATVDGAPIPQSRRAPPQRPGLQVLSQQTTTQSAAVDKKTAREILAGESKSAATRTKLLQAQSAQSQDLLSRQAELQKRQRADAETYATTLGQRGDAVHKRLTRLTGELDQMRKDLKGSTIKTLGGYDRTSKTMLLVAAAMEGTAAASLRRPSNTAGLLRMAIETDLKNQRDNLRLRMEDLDLTQQQRDQALLRFDKLEDQRRQQGTLIAQMQLAELATEGKTADVKFSAAESALKLGDALRSRKLQLAQLSRGKTTTTTQKGTVPTGLGVALDKSTERKLRADFEQLTSGEALISELRGLLGGAASKSRPLADSGVPDAKANEIKRILRFLALVNRTAVGDSGPIRAGDDEFFSAIESGRFSSVGRILDTASSLERRLKASKVRKFRQATRPVASIAQEVRDIESRGAIKTRAQ